MASVYIGLGGNLGDRKANLDRAIAILAESPGIEVIAVSPFYETPPWGFLDQPAFLNAVARLAIAEESLGPLGLLTILKRAESLVGREKTFRWGPRVVDLDILIWYGTDGSEYRLNRRGLILPHPRMAERAFVLVPLRDLYPGYCSPDGKSINQMIDDLIVS